MSDQIAPTKTFDDALKALPAKRRVFVLEYLSTLNQTEAARRAKFSFPAEEGHRLLKNAQVSEVVELGFAKFMGKNEILSRESDVARGTMEDFTTLEEIEYRERIPVPAFERREQLRGRQAEALDGIEIAKTDQEKKGWQAVYAEAEREMGLLPDNPLELVSVEGPIRKAVVARVDLVKAQANGKMHLIKKLKQTDRGLELELYDAHAARELLSRYYKLLSDRVSFENPDGTPIVSTKVKVNLKDLDPAERLALYSSLLKVNPEAV